MKNKLLTAMAVGLSVYSLAQTTTTFNYTGAVQTFTVPSCVTSITIEAYGAQGSNATTGGTGGLGGYAVGTMNVLPGDVLYIYVGGQNGYNGGGTGGQDGNSVYSGPPGSLAASGGGASDVRLNGNALTDRVIVAGGGGGGGSNGVWPGCQVAGPAGNGGAGGGTTGGNGTFGVGTPCNCGGGGGDGGLGGTSTAGGLAGGYYGSANCLRAGWTMGQDGTLGQGGNGSLAYYNGTGGGGGGGGGYYGGGAGGNGSDTTPGGGGGGGSSYTGTLTSASTTAGSQSGDGMVVLTYIGTAPAVPSSITGPASVCTGSSVSYSISAVAGASGYTWAVPSGSTITAGQGTTSITMTAGSVSGDVTVTADNSCGSSAAATYAITINALPVITAAASSPAVCLGMNDTLTASGASTYAWSSGGTNATEVVAPSVNSTYTVIGTDMNGCNDTTMISVSVNALPVVTASASSATVCSGTNDTLMVSGASAYAWSSGGTGATEIVAPSTNSTYTVIGTDMNGCSDTTMISVSVNALPAVAASASSMAICSGAADTLTASGAIMYAWSSGGTNATEIVMPSASTTYVVTGTDGNGCMNSDSVTVTVNPTPVITISGGPFTGCAPMCVQFVATGSPNCVISQWNFGDSATSGNSSPMHCYTPGGIYSVIYTCTDANGCTGTATTTITAYAPPVASLTVSPSTYCVTDAPGLLSGTPSGGTYSGPGVTGSSFSPSAAGVGTQPVVYTYTDMNGCSDTAMVPVTVNLCAGVDDISSPGALNIFPNPTNGVFTLAVNANEKNLLIEV
ncbi:MAG TPA: glycine-rich protein, partial [Bacteroidia bacterium]|nr:glycine-rich protein [Bacteroidia bacterium]